MHEFQLPDMTCGHCAGVVGKALHLADPDCKIQVDLPARKVSVRSNEDRDLLAEALTDAGYPPA
ncbi:MAG TPA: heavy-metal-associated domain-containing protein [Hydrogenophaga sp.]|uniref:heavy-metal-associated domain-containing protein n=1 Tax=Hydrogenophaga sp. TaxID=1904254 RepID=UPI002C7B21A7|nr:heavy-metal-associated domain-containing protein [Hydrogenophaga sp.]HMN93853.1 heavy-metal-associated domain-containing protein [Hydrogenophaga sp.]HMP09868.1 heavy-metal-associated domain-containing protein [Hydrogenophaga sp.]